MVKKPATCSCAKKVLIWIPQFPVKKTTPKIIVKFGLTNLYNEQCNNHMHTTAHAILDVKISDFLSKYIMIQLKTFSLIINPEFSPPPLK